MHTSPFDGALAAGQRRDEAVDPVQLRSATLASSIGSALEYYDFYIFGLATALVFGPLFFAPFGDASMIASFAAFGIAYAARPLGGFIFGFIGDRWGRKVVLLSTILLMGSASFLIGVLPTYSQIGAAAPILLIALRILQGLGAGAEQAGATTLISEVAPAKRRGFFAALPFVGIQLGTFLGAGTFTLLGLANQQIVKDWLWRVPFLCSVVLIITAVLIRLRLKETPVFQEIEKHQEVVKNPIGAVLRTSWRTVLKGIGIRLAENGNSSIYSAVVVGFLGTVAAFKGDKAIGPAALLVAAGVAAVAVVTFGALSDRFGRVKVYRYGALFQAIIAIPAFYLVTLGQPWLVYVVIAVGTGIGVQSTLGPQCSLLPEMFGATRRFTGVALSREISAMIASGLVPFLIGILLAATKNSWMVLAGFSLALALITFATTFTIRETKGRDLTALEDGA
ncbi:MFS transporter [Sinomonas sp. ASV322]|uniref:MFS transporter n=1 Tax=Sinomonas sp. ASV322 TaxID=3041920 RepID=UPI0027DB3696|nr:MFS transporter [Sinomonas sp. ASV322]MDQ4502286.1 MFS transporter [Sinomonas sp. ASV322]